jgi:putative membrane protein
MRPYLLLFTLALALGVAGTSAAAPGPNVQDQTFVTMAGHAGAAEIAAAKLALNKASDPSTLAFAHRMIRDHTALAAKLKLAAAAVGLKPPSAPSAAQAGSIKSLGKLKGQSFATSYRKSQIAAHEGAIALFTAESTHGLAPSLKDAAAAALPMLKMHLALAKSMGA